MAAGAAAYSATAVSSLRGIESTWRSATAVDRLRAKADAEVVSQFAALQNRDDPAAEAARKDIGEEASFRFGAYERALRTRRIRDGGVAKVRDAMVEALQVRSRQLTPARRFIGDARVRAADAALAAALRRWRLPARPDTPEPRLMSVDSARANLAHWADWTTYSVLVATDGAKLYVLDLDRDLAAVRTLDRPNQDDVDAMVLAGPGVVLLAGGLASAYDLSPSTPSTRPAWSLPATAIADRAGGGLWVANDSTVTAVDDGGSTIGSPVRLPRDRRMVGAVGDRLVLSWSSLATWSVEVWDPRTPAAAAVVLGDGALVATDEDQVAFQRATGSPLELGHELDIVRLPSMAVRTVELPPTDAGPGSFSSDGRRLAFPAGPLAGRIAGAVVYNATTSYLSGLGPPSAEITGGVVWSPNDQDVFWLTPEGRIAVWGMGHDSRILRMPYAGLRKFVGTGQFSIGG
ncbi:MAG: hypothetical protein QOF60_3354 [Actinomycetota bacterium]|nr:hypothetical protein [Actinomycetota bacterium]